MTDTQDPQVPLGGEEESSTPMDIEKPCEGPTPEEAVVMAESLKEEGNGILKAGDPKGAVVKYAEGVALVEPLLGKDPGELGEDLQRRATSTYQALSLNSAQASLKLADWLATIEHADKVLVLDQDNAKALYRRGYASAMMNTEGRLEQARTDFSRLVTLDPSNREVRDQLARAKDRLKELKAEEKQRLSTMLSGGLYKDEHAKHVKQQAAYQAETFRRKEAGEDEISFDDWVKKQKENQEEEKRKQKEAAEKQRSTELERAERERHEGELQRRREAGEEEIGFEDWQAAEKAKEDERRRAQIGGVVRTDDADLDAEEKKLLEETKSKGYYHGRLGKVLSDAAPKPQQVAVGDACHANGKVGSEWNQAGTWEEKDQTAWAKENLTLCLQRASVSASEVAIPGRAPGTVTGRVSKVKSLSGDAQLVCVRKQAKHGYNFEAELSFSLTLSGAEETKISGAFSIPELVDSVQPADLRIDTRWKGSGPPPELQGVCLEWLDKLRAEVRCQVAAFREEYQKRR